MTFPAFQSSAMWPAESDWEKSRDKCVAKMCLVCFQKFEIDFAYTGRGWQYHVIDYRRSIISKKVTGDMGHPVLVGSIANDTLDFAVKSDKNAVMKTFAHSASFLSSPDSLVKATICVCGGFITCKNFRAFLISMFSKFMWKKKYLAFWIAV